MSETSLMELSAEKVSGSKLLTFFGKFSIIDVLGGPKYTYNYNNFPPQPTITCSKLRIETLEQSVDYVQSKDKIKTPE